MPKRALKPYPELRADCSKCAGLCCMAFAFDRSEKFAFDKAAGEPCRHLGAGHGCTIHADLDDKGFAGCVEYDCIGAGQRVTQEVFGGQSWQDKPVLAAPMMEAFRGMRKVHELLELLKAMDGLTLSNSQKLRKLNIEKSLMPNVGWTPQSLLAFERGSTPAEVQSLLIDLRAQISKR